jgi:GlpG protein
MRLIGTLATQDDALTFTDYLITLGMPAHVEQGRDNAWQVWIERDDDVEQGQLQLREYVANPNQPKYADVAAKASRIRKEAFAEAQKRRKNYKDLRTSWSGVPRHPTTVTMLLIIISVGIFFLQQTKMGPQVMDYLFFFTPLSSSLPTGEVLDERAIAAMTDTIARAKSFGVADAFREIFHGQVWRLVTPALMHGSILHIAFNCYYVLLFGSAIEGLKGQRVLLPLVLVSAIISNCAQAIWQSMMPMGGFGGFLGLSGINYALFGYVWMRGKYTPQERLGAPPQTVGFMLGWLLICMTGLVGPIANAAHLIGLLVGTIFGAWPTIMRRIRKS